MNGNRFQSMNLLSSQNIPYNIENLFTQICQYKVFKTSLKKAILLNDRNIIKRVRLINAKWFKIWKKISCYEAIKDLLNLFTSIQNNYKSHLDKYLIILNNLEINERLDINIHNNAIVSGYDSISQRFEINPNADFELISPELWDSFVPPNTNNVNNGTLIEFDLEYLTKLAFMINLGKNSIYVIFWNVNNQKIEKIILTFESEEKKTLVLDNLKLLGINNFYACYLGDLTDEKYINIGNICFNCINKSKYYNNNNIQNNNNFRNNNSNWNNNLPPVGLVNIGLICYMNSALQSLVNIPKLSNYFLEKKYQINENTQILAYAYLKVVENLKRKTFESQTITAYSPIEFKSIAEINPLFRGAADSIDLINFFLETIHQELKNMTNENSISKYIITNPIGEKQIHLNMTINNFIINENSIITNVFYLIEKSKLKCLSCNQFHYNYQFLRYLIFPLEEIRQYNLMNFGKNQNYITLKEGFDFYKRVTPMLGNFYCNKCGIQSKAIQCSSIYSLNEILIINLNRGRGNIYNVGVQFSEYINLSNEVESKIYDNSKYKLISVITHFGSSGISGHFISFCFVHDKNKWYKFNDSMVSESNFIEASSTGDAYILFYQRQ